MTAHDLIVIGASAGGIDALKQLCALLPADLPAAICIVQHTSAQSPGLLPQILARDCRLTVVSAIDHMPLALGTIHIAPPDRHLLIDPGRLRVVRGPRENLHRPSIDPLFRSAAAAYGERVIGVVLTGMLTDGTAGLEAIKTRRGVTIVQDPREAQFASMPLNALHHVHIDHCLPIAGIATTLVGLSGEADAVADPPPPAHAVAQRLPSRIGAEADMAKGEHNDPSELDGIGKLSSFTCPECHGSLWELDDEAVLRYRCHVGHAFTVDSLHQGQVQYQERALWVATRALEEQATLFRRMARRSQDHGQGSLADRFEHRARSYRHDAEILRSMLTREHPIAPIQPESADAT